MTSEARSRVSPRAVAVLQALAVVVLGSLSGVLAKRSLGEVRAFTFAWLQIAIGVALLTIYTFGIRRERLPRRLGARVWACIAAIGIGNFTIVRVMFLLSLERLPANTHIFLVNFVGIVTMLMSVALLRERPNRIQIAGTLLAIIGLWVFFAEIPPPGERIGLLFVVLGVLALALTNNLARMLVRLTDRPPPNVVVSTVAAWIGGGPVVLWGLLTDCPPDVPTGVDWGVIAMNGVVAITVGLTVWNHILRTLRSFEASVLGGASVIFVALFAIPILGERLAGHQVAGVALMITGLVGAQMRRPPRGAVDFRS